MKKKMRKLLMSDVSLETPSVEYPNIHYEDNALDRFEKILYIQKLTSKENVELRVDEKGKYHIIINPPNLGIFYLDPDEGLTLEQVYDELKFMFR